MQWVFQEIYNSYQIKIKKANSWVKEEKKNNTAFSKGKIS